MEMIQHSESVLDDTVPSPPVSSANHTNPAGQPGYQDLTSPRDVDYVDSPCSDPGADDTKSGDGEASSSMSDANYPPDVKYGIEELCPVCGDKVSGYHYGLLTCESCKGFFKRTVQNKKVYSCVDNRNCAIDKTQRKRCPYCRFQKCLSVGMKLEAVRPDRMRGGRNKFGPMYKRDRAMKQQAIRQRQHILAQYQMHMAANGGMGALPPPDSLDIKPDISAINMAVASMGTPLPPHNTNQGYNSLPPPPMHGQHMIPSGPPVQIDDGPNSPTAVDMTASSSSSQGHYRTPPHPHHPHAPRYHPPVPQAMPDMSHPPPLQSMYPMQEQIPQPPVVPQLIKDLRINELNEQEIQQKMARFAENEFLQIQHQPQPNQEINQPRDLTRDFLQLMCKLCDQCLFLLVEWARSSTFFKALKVEDQMKLLQNCWSELLILDFIYRQRAHNKTDEYLMVTGQSMKAEMFTRLGLSDVEQRLQDVSKKMRELRIDRNEYTCLKFLILLNPDVSSLQERSNVEDSQEKINAALLEYCSGFYPHIKDKFGQLLLRLPEIRVISLRIEEYLYLRHLGGEVPEQTLLMEMLHAKRK